MTEAKYYIFDIETISNIFTFTGKFVGEDRLYVFELSTRMNERDALLSHLSYLQNCGAIMVGYNNLGFDWPIVQDLMSQPYTFDYNRAYQMCREIFDNKNYGDAGRNHTIWKKNRFIPQLDLVKINHFDNANKRVSLKSLEFAMRLDSVEDFGIFHRDLTLPEMDKLKEYNAYDVFATEMFFHKCKHMIDTRQEFLETGVVTGDVLNFSDVKIGVEYLIKKIGRSKCFVKGSTPNNTIRQTVPLKDVILDKIQFRSEEFQAVRDWFSEQTVHVGVKDSVPKLEVTLAGLPFDFGLGGIHASVNNKKYVSNNTHIIRDIDVAAMYVAVANCNEFAPEHLGEAFTIAYKQLQRDRKQYPKGIPMNALLKLAGNGVYGNSNNPYSCFYDPKYTYTVTVTGQLQLLQLVELIKLIPGLELIQANTDGITVYMPREMDKYFQLWQRKWEGDTGLVLEEIEYSHMWIADVNNYLAVTTEGKVKRKGRYWYPETEKDYDGCWNKDFSSMVIQKAIGECLTRGWEPKDAIRLITDPFDFMLRYITPGTAKVYIGDQVQPKTVRYYISLTGGSMKKIAEPKYPIGTYKRKPKLTEAYRDKITSEIAEGAWDERIHTKNQKKYELTTTVINKDRLVKECNIASKFDWNDLDFDYYIKEIEKLMIK